MIDPEDFLEETGLIFHFNRTILHPLGLALSIVTEETEDGIGSRLELHETENAVGFVFSEEDMRLGDSKYKEFMKYKKENVLRRAKRLGFITQPLPEQK